jgi:hypothetical protein
MYFSKFGKMQYGFDKTTYKTVTDIMKRVKVRDKVINEMSLYNKYDVKSGDTPETIAFKHFGNPELHWVILLTNNITDRFYDWPMSEQEFEVFVKDKYSNPGGIHHYEVLQSSGKQTGNGPDDYTHKLEVNSTTSGATSVSNRDYEQRIQDNKRLIKLLDPRYLATFLSEFNALIGK